MSLTLLSPFAGTIHPIEEAPDPVFSMKMLGDGFFVTPSSNDVFSPVDGEITYVAPTKHGIRINAADGTKMTLLEHEAAKWLNRETIDSVDWLPADITLIGKIKEELWG